MKPLVQKGNIVLATAIIAFIIAVFVQVVQAADDVYKRGQDKEYIAGCDNPTTRTDGTLLDPASNPDDAIQMVYYYVGVTVDDRANALYTLEMSGGCMDSVPVDLKQFPVNTELQRYAYAKTMDGLESSAGVGPSFIVQAANPNAPGRVR